LKKNMGTLDRLIRTLLALVFVILIVTKVLTGALAIILGAVAVIFLLTSFFSFCSLYLPFRISTLRKKDESQKS